MPPTIKKLKLVFVIVVTAGTFMASVHSGSRTAAALGESRTRGFSLRVPLGLPAELWRKKIPADNPLTVDKVALGQSLYFDKRLSADGTLSCAVCHDPASALADRSRTAVGVAGSAGARNSPTILNAAFGTSQFWDGRVVSLEEQAKAPLVSPDEMGMRDYAAVEARVAAVGDYRRRFRRVFGEQGITIDTISKAIAAFERTQLSGNSPFDRFMAGDKTAISDAQKRGWALFRGKAGCVECHAFDASSPFFTDFGFHNTGVATKNRNFNELIRHLDAGGGPAASKGQAVNPLSHEEGFSELGRYLVTKRLEDLGAFKTPSLRDIELTNPYMHDGSVKTLLDVVRFYNRGGERNPSLDSKLHPLGLDEGEMNDLVEFLRALTSDDVLRRAQATVPQTRAPVPLPSPTIIAGESTVIH